MNLTGYASVTEVAYPLAFYDETIARGAFKKTLASKPDVQLVVNHSGLPLARTLSGTMRLSEDSKGLKVDADLDDEDLDVQSLARKMRRGDIDQMSFSFRAERQEWNKDFTARRIIEANIHRGDVSVVNQGASPTTFASVRAATARAGGRSAIPDRKLLAEGIGKLAVIEMRSLTLDGETFNLRAAGDDCGRCDGEGTIVLSGATITCPQCGGSGGPEGNAEDSDRGHAGRARVRPPDNSYMSTQRARIALARNTQPPLPPMSPQRRQVENLRYPKGN